MKKIIGITAIITLCMMAIGCGSKTTSEYLDDANKFIAQGNYKAAEIELKNAVSKDPTNAQARLLLGKVHFHKDDFESAEKELAEAIELGVPDIEVLPIYAQTLLATGRHDLLDKLPTDNLTPEGLAPVLAAKSLSNLSLGNINEAKVYIEEAVKVKSDDAFTLFARARFELSGQGNREVAKQYLTEALKVDPEFKPALNMLGDIAVQEEDYQRAIERYSDALKLTGDDFGLHYKRALVYLSNKQADKAEMDLEVLRKIAKDHPGISFLEGLKAFNNGNQELAKEYFQKATIADKSYPLAYYYLAGINQQEGNIDTAKNNINRFIAIAPNNTNGLMLAAALEMQSKNIPRAESLLRTILFSNPGDIQAMNLLANVLINKGEKEEALSLLEKIKTLNPDSPDALTRLGTGYILSGDTDLAINNLQQALDLNPANERAELALIMSYLQKGDVESAVKVAENKISQSPDSASSYNLLARVYLSAKNIEKAREQFQKAFQVEPGNPEAGLNLGNLAFQDRDFADAKNILDQVLQKHPGHLSVLLNLAAIEAIQGNEVEMVKHLEAAQSEHPEAVKPRVILARYYLLKKQPEKVEPLLDQLSPDKQSLPEVLTLIASSELDLKQYSSALTHLKELVKAQPENPANYYQVARAYAGSNEIPKAIDNLNKAVELKTDYLEARIALSRLLLHSGQAQPFEEQVNQLQKLAPDNVEVVELRAALANLKGNDELATQLFLKAFTESPSDQSALALAMHYIKSSQYDKAIEVLKGRLSSNDNSIAIHQALAETYLKSNQQDFAIKQYERIIKLDPENPSALNNLAWNLMDQNPGQALTYATKAVELAPESATVLDTAAMVYMKNGKLEEARQSIDAAEKLLPENDEIKLHSAKIYIQEGKKREAINILEKMAKDNSSLKKEEAQVLFNQLTD